METKEYSLKINNEAKLVIITGITNNAISIDFSGDIDFTKLVTELTHSIDSKTILIPKENNDTSDESTMKLILETIDAIVIEYNNTIKSLEESDDELESEIEIDDSLL